MNVTITIFTFIASVFWCNVFIIIVASLRNNINFILKCGIRPLLLIMAACMLRLLCFFEFPNISIITSSYIYPEIIMFFKKIQDAVFGSIHINGFGLIVTIWFVGSFSLLIKYFNQRKCISEIQSKSRPITDTRAAAILNEVAGPEKAEKVKIFQSAEITIPMITGYISPVIYLPEAIFTETELRYILMHEWMHFLHKDAWIKTAVYGISIIFWWNPFVHILQSDLNHLLEVRCDSKVIVEMEEESKTQYLHTLLKVIENHVGEKNQKSCENICSSSVLVSGIHSTKIEQRFELVLKSGSNKKRRKYSVPIYVIIVVVFFVSNIFIIQPVFEPTADRGFEDSFTITEQNSYLKKDANGDYELYINGEYVANIGAEQVAEAPFSSLSIQ